MDVRALVRARLGFELPEACVAGVGAAIAVLAEHAAAIRSAVGAVGDSPSA